MPYLTDLGVACRKSGLRVVEQPNWRGRGHGPFKAVNTIACHHTAGPASGEAPSLGVVTNGRPGLDGPLSQIVLGRSGTVYVVAAGVAWHAGATWTAAQDNYHAIGIEAEATGVSAWPAVQYDAYARLCRALIDHYRLPVSAVQGHKEICKPAGRKIDPNFDMNAFRAAVGRVGTPAPPQQEDDLTPEQDAMLRVIHRELTIRLKRRAEGSTFSDTLLGYALNADSFGLRANEALARVEAKLGDLAGAIPRQGVGQEGATSVRAMAAWNDATHSAQTKALDALRAEVAALRGMIEAGQSDAA